MYLSVLFNSGLNKTGFLPKTIRIMKLTTVLLIVACLQVSAKAYTQKVTLNENNVSLQKVFQKIRKQTGYQFLYADEVLVAAKKVSVNIRKGSIEDVLDLCFQNQHLTYVISDNTVIIKRKLLVPATNILYQSLSSIEYQELPPIEVHGRVVDENENPLVNASVTIKGTNQGVTTNTNGDFNIDIPDTRTILVFSYTGYESKEVQTGSRTIINVNLLRTDNSLNEVVVTALGIKRQVKSLGYSTTEIPGSNLTESRTPNLANALSGQIAGVSVAGTGTGPNGSTRITIRGNSSLTGGGTPLYIIDGVPYGNENQGSSGKYGGTDNGDALSMINPDDIESINVLKGVAGSALYGYRGGNGVIIITTKSGSHSKGIGVEINNNATLNTMIDESDFQYEYGQGTNGVRPLTIENAQTSAISSWGDKLDGSDYINFLGNAQPYIAHKDNIKNFYQKGLSNQTTVSLSGNNNNGNFRLGISNMNMSEVIPNAGMEQQGINFRTEYNLTDKLHLIFAASYMHEKVKNRPRFSDSPGNVFASVSFLASSFDVRDLAPGIGPDGTELLPIADNIYQDNPYFLVKYQKNTSERDRYTGNVTLKYDIANWISVQGQISRNSLLNDQSNITPSGTARSLTGSLNVSSNNRRELDASFMFDINKKFGNDFTVHANLGGNYQDNLYKASNTGGRLDIPYWYSVNNIISRPYNIDFSEYKVNSFFGSADLAFKNYLFLSVTARNDWFSTLNPKTNSILYPSVSGSFVFSDAIKMPDWITFGKLRVSYAQSSAGTSPYQNSLTFSNVNIVYRGLVFSTITQSVVPNSFLKPLSIRETEVGLSMSFLNNRLNIDAAVYNKITEDDILNVSTSMTSGYTAGVENVGKLRNRGLELLVGGTPVQTSNFSWKPSFNIAINSSKVLFLSPGVSNLQLGSDANPGRYGTFSIQQIVGEEFGQIVGYKYLRDDKGNRVYDASGLPIRGEFASLGSGVYKTTGGFSNDLRYKNFTLSTLLDFKFGAKIFSVTNNILYQRGLHKQTLLGREGGYVGPGVTVDGKVNTTVVDAERYWSTRGGSKQVNDIAEEFVYDASFIKLRNVSLSYSFPISPRAFIKSLTFSLVGRNLAILLKHTPNIDPESNLTNGVLQGLEYNPYPQIRNIGFNVNVKF